VIFEISELILVTFGISGWGSRDLCGAGIDVCDSCDSGLDFCGCL